MSSFEDVLKAHMDKYYRELGAMTALFTDLDALIRDAAIDLLGCADERISAWLVAPVDFSRKIDMLEWLINHHADKRGISGSNEIQSVSAALSRVKAIWSKRNDHVHGNRIYDQQMGEYMLLNPAVFRQKASKAKSSRRVAKVDARELLPMNQELISLFLELHSALPILRMQLEGGNE